MPHSDARTFRIYDASIGIVSNTHQPEISQGYRMPWNRPDWETYNRVKDTLAAIGFQIGKDPHIEGRYRCLSKSHHAGQWRNLKFVSHVYPTGCEFKFFQDIVFENRNGGKYDFDRRRKMPYLIGLQFEHAARIVRQHLLDRGFTNETKPSLSPAADPLAWFNEQWDSDYERRRGVHRFERGTDGWPTVKEIGESQCRDADGTLLSHGVVRYARDRKGYLTRGRVYGGINGMWLFVYGPGPTDHTHLSHREFFTCRPTRVPRKQWDDPRRGRSTLKKLEAAKRSAVAAENFERAAQLRDVIARTEASGSAVKAGVLGEAA